MKDSKVLDTNLIMSDISSGTTTILNIIEYPKAIEKNLKILWPTKLDYYTALNIMLKLLEKGKPVPAIDVLLASICINNNKTLKTKDKHFKFILEVEPDFKIDFV